MKWTQEEKDMLLNYAFNDDSESIDDNIKFAMYKMYEEEMPPLFTERSFSAVKTMFYKERKARMLTNN